MTLCVVHWNMVSVHSEWISDTYDKSPVSNSTLKVIDSTDRQLQNSIRRQQYSEIFQQAVHRNISFTKLIKKLDSVFSDPEECYKHHVSVDRNMIEERIKSSIDVSHYKQYWTRTMKTIAKNNRNKRTRQQKQ